MSVCRSNVSRMGHLDLSRVSGQVWTKDHPDYEKAAQPHQLAVQQSPEAVAIPTDVEDLRAVLEAVREAGLTLAVQAGGHGASEDLAGSVLVRMDSFDQLTVDEQGRRAVVGAGVRAEALATALAGTALFAATGTSPDVSLVGLTLNGGHSWLSRMVGTSAQTVRRVELLRPDGEHGWVDDSSDPELMRVLRGAGGVLGVVTAIELDLVHAPGAMAGSLTFAPADGPAAWRAMRDAEVDDAVSIFAASMRMPDAPFLPEQVRGKSWVGVQALALDGQVAAIDAVRAAASPLSDQVGPIGPEGVAALTNDPRDAGASAGLSVLLTGLPDEAIDAMLGWHRTDAGAAVVLLGVRRLGGALDRPGRPAIAGTRGATWLMSAIAPMPPGAADATRAALAQLGEVVAPWVAPGGLPTFLGSTERLDRVLTGEDLAALHALRERLGASVIRPTRL
ncbi:hypothetical protein GCM10027067_06790 [Pseudactinotalea suaedae]